MLELPDYTGRDPEHIKSSLRFFIYHINHTLSGKEKASALEAVRAKAAEHGIEID